MLIFMFTLTLTLFNEYPYLLSLFVYLKVCQHRHQHAGCLSV